MKKKILVLLTLMLSATAIFSKDFAFAKADLRAEKDEKVKEINYKKEEKVTEVQNKIQTKVEEKNTGISTAIKNRINQITENGEEKLIRIKEEKKEKLDELASKKDEMKAKIEEKKLQLRTDAAARHTVHMEKRFSFYSTRLSEMIGKFQAKLDTIKNSGLDTSLAQEKLNEAADMLVLATDQANTAISEFAAIEIADFESQQELSKAAQTAATTARNSYKAVHMKLVEALEIMEDLTGTEEMEETEDEGELEITEKGEIN